MYKTLLLLCLLCMLITQEAKASAGYIFDEENGDILVGGYAIEGPRYRIAGDTKNLEEKLYWIAMDGEAHLFFKADAAIARFARSNVGYVAVNKSGYRLDIVRPDGILIRSFDGIMTMAPNSIFSWSPDGHKIAFIEAQKTEGIVSYIPRGVYIFDIDKNEVEKISDFAMELNWSRHDGNIYLQSTFGKNEPPEFQRYNPKTKKTEKAPRDSIYYSDSGRFCIVGKWDSDGADNYIYDGQANQFVTRGGRDGESVYTIDYVYGFLPGKELIWSTRSTPFYILYEANDGKTIYYKSNTALIGWNKLATKGVIYQGQNKITIVDLSTGQKLFDIELPK